MISCGPASSCKNCSKKPALFLKNFSKNPNLGLQYGKICARIIVTILSVLKNLRQYKMLRRAATCGLYFVGAVKARESGQKCACATIFYVESPDRRPGTFSADSKYSIKGGMSLIWNDPPKRTPRSRNSPPDVGMHEKAAPGKPLETMGRKARDYGAHPRATFVRLHGALSKPSETVGRKARG